MKRPQITARDSKLAPQDVLLRHDASSLGGPPLDNEPADLVRLMLLTTKPRSLRRVSFGQNAVEWTVEAAKDAGECYAKIKGGIASGAVIGTAAGPVGSVVGAVGGAIVAAFECGLFGFIADAFEAIGEWLADLFTEDPVGNYQQYLDVGGPALRRTNWTADTKYDLYRLNIFVLSPQAAKLAAETGMSLDEAMKKVQAGFFERVPGTNLTFLQTRWLARRFEELGGGAEEVMQLNYLLGGPKLETKADYAAYQKKVQEFRASNDFRNGRYLYGKGLEIKRYAQLAHRAGYNGVEALRMSRKLGGRPTSGAEYNLLKARAEAELQGLRGLLNQASLAPTPEQLQERAVPSLVKFNWGQRFANLPSTVRIPPSVRKLITQAGDTPFASVAPQESGSALPLILLVAAGAFLLLRK